MDYGELIRRAWQLTWQNRFLWVLGLFAASTVGSCSPTGAGNGVQYRADQGDVERFFSADLVRAFQQADPFLSRNIGWLILSLFALGVLVFLVFMVVSLIAQGGMAEATSELALARPVSAGSAWNQGLQLFWRYLLLWLLLFGLGLLFALLAAIVIGVVVAVGMSVEGAPRTMIAVIGGLLGIAALVVVVPALIAASIVVAFAQRAIAMERAGPWQALGIGARLVRRNLGASALAWLVNLAVSLGVGIVIVLVALLLLLPLGALAVAIFYATGAVISTTLAAYAVVAILALLAALWVVAGVANAFFWNYWTLIYLHLTGRLTARLEPPPAT